MKGMDLIRTYAEYLYIHCLQFVCSIFATTRTVNTSNSASDGASASRLARTPFPLCLVSIKPRPRLSPVLEHAGPQHHRRQVSRAANIMVHAKDFSTVHLGLGVLRIQAQNPLTPLLLIIRSRGKVQV